MQQMTMTMNTKETMNTRKRQNIRTKETHGRRMQTSNGRILLLHVELTTPSAKSYLTLVVSGFIRGDCIPTLFDSRFQDSTARIHQRYPDSNIARCQVCALILLSKNFFNLHPFDRIVITIYGTLLSTSMRVLNLREILE